MNIKSIVLVTAAFFCALSAAASASAAILTETYSGTVTSGTDSNNLFGGGDLTGDTFRAVFTFDTTLGSISASNHELDNGIVGLSVKIGSITVSGSGNGFPNFTFVNDGSISASGGLQPNYRVTAQANTFALPPPSGNLFTPANANYDFGSGGLTLHFVFSDEGYINANFTSASLAVSSVPEPSTWAMMILGFAGIGAMTYRRRKSAMIAA